VTPEPRGDRRREEPSSGRSFYDEPGSFERYRSHRHGGVSSPSVVMEEPAVREELGSVEGQRILDLGCGDGAFGRAMLAAECRSYSGIDSSARMVEAAQRTLRGTLGTVTRDHIERFSAPPNSFDVIVSRLALHYIADLRGVLTACRECLAPDGRVLFTVVHPVITSHEVHPSSPTELRTSWVVDDYFEQGPRERSWLGGKVVWHHRTVEEQVLALRTAGFTLTALRECAPRRERFDGDESEFARRQRVPLFLLLAGAVAQR